jgi:D-alanyl-lipoteichoic acid acyltransferase DltB (MBOAT superfamily)
LIFNSIDFGILFFVTLAACAVLPRFAQLILLAASFVFYSWISWFFGVILFAMSVCGFVYPYVLARTPTPAFRAVLTAITVLIVLSPLLFLKYWNFLIDTAIGLGISGTLATARVAYPLPPGISFHSFQLVAYVVDVFVGRTRPERRPSTFFLYSSFFPQLVAGPIERPNHLIPQLPAAGPVRRENIEPAVQLFVYGLFLKVAIADVVSVKVDEIYAGPSESGAELLFGTLLFYAQIYCDFAGYTLMALGVARALGVRLVQNFHAPIVATSPRDFWRRWHISLSSWFRDYVYIPLGGDRRGAVQWLLAIAATFVLSGLWHGAKWTFVVWGGLHGAGLVIGVLVARYWPSSWRGPLVIVLAWFVTQLFIVLTWVFFRARSIEEASTVVARIARDFVLSGTGWSDVVGLSGRLALPGFVIAGGVVIAAWVTRIDLRYFRKPDGGPFALDGPVWSHAQQAVMLGAVGFALLAGQVGEKPFIYFQF